jgi:hypothetical protein
MITSSSRFENSTEKIRTHRKNLLSLLSLKRSILEYEKSPSQKQLLPKGKTVEVKGQQAKGKWKQSRTIHTDMSACTSDRLLEKPPLALQPKGQRSSTKLSLRRDEPQVDLRKEISSKINAMKSAQTVASLLQSSKQEGVHSRAGQFLGHYKSSYRMEGRKLTVADKQHMEIEKMASEAARLKDTSDSAAEEQERPPKEEPRPAKGRSAAEVRLTVKARMEMRRELPSKTILKERYQVLEKIGRGLSG